MSQVFLRLTAVAVVLFATTGCGGGGGGDTVTKPTPSSPVSPVSPAPLALQGVWVTTLTGSGQKVTLTLGATDYRINRGANQASGTIAVTDNQIKFSDSTACNGDGTYRWVINGTSLLFTTDAPDACPGRSEVLAGYTYVKGV